MLQKTVKDILITVENPVGHLAKLMQQTLEDKNWQLLETDYCIVADKRIDTDMWTKKPKFVERFLSALFTERDEFAVKYLSKVFLDFEMDFSPIPTIKESEAKKITKPMTIIGADDDLMFPGEKLLKRARSIFPSLKKEWLLNDSKHVQRKADNQKIESLILDSIG